MNHFQKVFSEFIAHQQLYQKTDAGESYKGIIRQDSKLWPGWFIIDELKRFNKQFPDVLERAPHLQDMVRFHYQTEVWDKFLGDRLRNQHSASILFDLAWRYGAKHTFTIVFNAIHLLTRSEIFIDKNKITIETTDVINSLSSVAFAKAVYGLQFNFLKNLENPEQFNHWFQS